MLFAFSSFRFIVFPIPIETHTSKMSTVLSDTGIFFMLLQQQYSISIKMPIKNKVTAMASEVVDKVADKVADKHKLTAVAMSHRGHTQKMIDSFLAKIAVAVRKSQEKLCNFHTYFHQYLPRYLRHSLPYVHVLFSNSSSMKKGMLHT